MDIMKLALFDTILLIDDSGSMAFVPSSLSSIAFWSADASRLNSSWSASRRVASASTTSSSSSAASPTPRPSLTLMVFRSASSTRRPRATASGPSKMPSGSSSRSASAALLPLALRLTTKSCSRSSSAPLAPVGFRSRSSSSRLCVASLLGAAFPQHHLTSFKSVTFQTDGTPAGEPHDQVFRSIINANNELSRTRYGGDAVSYQFAQVRRAPRR